ncbi:sulfite exporter TauE/SafE family protein [Lysinibacillus piscis]|uniref:Probable membrane transporter protein n=1 Tax=Lysinibacillus piscis TaxID=2518931 RepID=A0ABQ5NL77_9BACI|nr:sulfite exporter TauE/SafE family protein [Lysinibacillus sp. KH24]GLC88852.1 UPF0721 transmembrane protein [Lysinibacillus sp. KH24]
MEYILFLAVGVIGSIIGTLIGGGGLITLPTMLLMGVPVHSAIGANKISTMVSSFSIFYTIFKNKELAWKEVYAVLIVSLVGGTLGGLFAALLSGQTLTLVAIILLSFALITSFVSGIHFGDKESFLMDWKKGAVLLGIGIYDGLFGPGSTTLAIYTYAYSKVSYIKAIGLSRVGVFAMGLGAATIYIITGKINWTLTCTLTIGSIIGAQIGIALARKIKIEQVKLLLRIVTLLLIVQLLYDFIN